MISFFKFNNSLTRHNNISYIYYIYVNNRYSCLNIEINTIWNICDSGNTTQGVMSDILGKLFNIKTGFYGVLISNFARLNLSSIVDEANDKHMKPWNELCARNNIRATPLDPYMDKELLSSNHLYIDGTGISTKTGFKYKYDKISIDLIKEVVLDAIDQNLFPNIFKQGNDMKKPPASDDNNNNNTNDSGGVVEGKS